MKLSGVIESLRASIPPARFSPTYRVARLNCVSTISGIGWLTMGLFVVNNANAQLSSTYTSERGCAPTIRMPYAQSHEIKLDMVAEQNACTGTFHTLGEYELDHIVPLCMGGSNDRSNLQLQTWDDAKRKDVDEVALCEMVKSGVLTCQEAQQTMRTWK